MFRNDETDQKCKLKILTGPTDPGGPVDKFGHGNTFKILLILKTEQPSLHWG